MRVKLLAFDLDGTTLISHRDCSARNREALVAAGKAGVILVPATGRIRSFLPPEITNIPHVEKAVTSNGAAVVDLKNGECLHGAYIDPETAVQVQAILNDYDIYLEYYVNGTAYTLKGNPERARNDKEFPASKHHFLTKDYRFIDDFNAFVSAGICPEKINMPFLRQDVRREIIERVEVVEGLKWTSSIPDNLEINSSAATKGQALKWLCGYLGIEPAECMAIGDNGNDADMLRYAGVSVAVENASPEARSCAKYLVAECEKDGLADAIERFILT